MFSLLSSLLKRPFHGEFKWIIPLEMRYKVISPRKLEKLLPLHMIWLGCIWLGLFNSIANNIYCYGYDTYDYYTSYLLNTALSLPLPTMYIVGSVRGISVFQKGDDIFQNNGVFEDFDRFCGKQQVFLKRSNTSCLFLGVKCPFICCTV